MTPGATLREAAQRTGSFMPGNPYFRLSAFGVYASHRRGGKPSKSAGSPTQWLQNPRIGISSWYSFKCQYENFLVLYKTFQYKIILCINKNISGER
ncbi:hypothetical protein QUB80_33580 [Chlorogloeopsis sp. ULAP01]|uniref:hypothetical protein n=1 Tax=Chlorogloeopsis sp. ULAP01 TaxID=3056483 RepID=UPI0025AA7450|nr:hypothetical protein [Chlorogloeopsis sp. ULAP01]MDM9385589.1 hypothetical protein [Chlorogloeopsis sp. ULAP01]